MYVIHTNELSASLKHQKQQKHLIFSWKQVFYEWNKGDWVQTLKTQKQWDSLRISNEGNTGILFSALNERPKFLVYRLGCRDFCSPVFEDVEQAMTKSPVFFCVEKPLVSNKLDFISFPRICKIASKLSF